MDPTTEPATLEALRAEIAIGIEQADRGELLPLDVEQIKAQGRRRRARRRQGGERRSTRSESGAETP